MFLLFETYTSIHHKMLLFSLVEMCMSFMDMSMTSRGLADLPGQTYVFFDVLEFSLREQFPLKSTHLHLEINGEQINVSTEIPING